MDSNLYLKKYTATGNVLEKMAITLGVHGIKLINGYGVQRHSVESICAYHGLSIHGEAWHVSEYPLRLSPAPKWRINASIRKDYLCR